ncbi:MAG TPA: hypothetical protein VGM90_16280 [Kofleriaceae bacterium]|jgi:hypothetical protein
MVALAQPAQAEEQFAADWLGAEASEPWLLDVDGGAIILSSECIGFRVRYWPPHARGQGELVLDRRTGLAMFVPRSVAPEEFRALVGYRVGRYRLAAVDESYQFLRSVKVACYAITPEMVEGDESGAAPAKHRATPAIGGTADTSIVLELLGLLRASNADSRAALSDALQVVKAQVEGTERHTSELVRATATVVTAADGAGISHRAPLPVAPPTPYVVEAPLPANEESPQAGGGGLAATLTSLAPAISHFVNTKVLGLSPEESSAALRAAASHAPAPSGGTTPPVASSPPPPSPPGATATAPIAPINFATVWPLAMQIAPYLTPDEQAVMRRFLPTASPEQLAELHREVSGRSPADAAAWLRSVFVEASREGGPL